MKWSLSRRVASFSHPKLPDGELLSYNFMATTTSIRFSEKLTVASSKIVFPAQRLIRKSHKQVVTGCQLLKLATRLRNALKAYSLTYTKPLGKKANTS